MRLLILSCNTGEGHNSAAGALEELVLSDGGTCEKVDALSFLSKAVSKATCAIHVQLYRAMPELWKSAYTKMEKESEKLGETPTLASRMLATGAPKLRRYLAANHFDAIFCVHPFSAVMLTYAAKKMPLDVPAVFLCTDYTCPPTTADQDLPYCCIAHEDNTQVFVSAGTRPETIRPTGIPVRSVFCRPGDRAAAREKLGVPADCVNVILMCGSMGCGPIEKLTEELAAILPENGLLTVFCGTNKKLLDALTKRAVKNVLPLGFTRDVPLWMDSADLFVTKPGGLSITEAANHAIPLLLMNVVGGCETPNFELFLRHGYAEGVEDPADAPALAAELLASPERRAKMVENQKRDFHGDAAEKIYALLKGEK